MSSFRARTATTSTMGSISVPNVDLIPHRMLRTASTTSFRTTDTSDSSGTHAAHSRRSFRPVSYNADRDGQMKLEEPCQFEPEQASMLLMSAREIQLSSATDSLTGSETYIYGKHYTYAVCKETTYYVEQLTQAISGQSHGRTQAERLVDLVTRSISGTNRQSQGLKDIILELKVQCHCQSMSWLKEFMDCGGLNALIFVLETMHSKSGRETLKILRLIANHHSGIADILYHQNHLNILIQSLDSPLLTARTATMDFLLALSPRLSKGSQTGHVSVVALIRFLVEVPTDFEYRMYLRSEFVASGVIPAFQKLKTWAQAEFSGIIQHVDAFEQLKASDFEYLIESLDTENDVDIYDPQQLLETLLSQVTDNDRRCVTSILQHLLVGTTMMDASSRSHMIYIIETAVMQIVLDQRCYGVH
ncbi:hypothetical protein BASA81_010525 [Batrachochytrium salamandrivorans]|nr:hypothetical protein BASA81_010525 [Batrachochytrium salamandrivorans]